MTRDTPVKTAQSAARRRAGETRLRESRLLPPEAHTDAPDADAVVDLGWGRLLFGNTFDEPQRIAKVLLEEEEDERDIAIYVQDPHVVLAAAPQSLFLDPSHTYRLWLQHYRPRRDRQRGFVVRRLRSKRDAQEINRLYALTNLVQVPIDHFVKNRHGRRMTYLVAEDEDTGAIVGTVTGVDHYNCFNDPERGASLWGLAVDPQYGLPGVGEALIRSLAEHFEARARSFLDLSVMHDNEPAIALYEKLGFKRLPLFTIKCRNPYNEPLYAPETPRERLAHDAEVILREARRRSIAAEIEDSEAGLFRLVLGGRSASCQESLSDMTSAVAAERCSDRTLTNRLLAGAGLHVPRQIEAGDAEDEEAFLAVEGRVVVKPARRECPANAWVDISDPERMRDAIEALSTNGERVLVEATAPGEHIRVLVLENRIAAAAIRRPAEIVGDGVTSARQLIEVQSRRRAAATGGECKIPLDNETLRCLAAAGYSLDDVPTEGETVPVRRTAKLTTGGTVHDVTAELGPRLAEAASTAARTLDIPVVGIDMLAPNPTGEAYVIFGADPQPSLAHHDTRQTASDFVDLLFPQTMHR